MGKSKEKPCYIIIFFQVLSKSVGWLSFVFIPAIIQIYQFCGGTIYKLIAIPQLIWFTPLALYTIYVLAKSIYQYQKELIKYNSSNSATAALLATDIEIKQKSLKRVSAHIQRKDNRIYVEIENKEWKIDVICSEIKVYEINQIPKSPTFLDLEMGEFQNMVHVIGASILPLLPTTKVDDTFIFIKHRSREEANFFTIKPKENQLEFSTLYKPQSLTKGSYNIVLGFMVFPQKKGYEEFNIYITIGVNYSGGSDLELCELRNARTND